MRWATGSSSGSGVSDMDDADAFFIVAFTAVGLLSFGVGYQVSGLGEAVTATGVAYTSMAASMLLYEHLDWGEGR